MRRLKPVTPGELLEEEFLKPMGISKYRLAKEIDAGTAHRRHRRRKAFGNSGH
jgi:plasmid maintenance system antidote protein VapI